MSRSRFKKPDLDPSGHLIMDARESDTAQDSPELSKQILRNEKEGYFRLYLAELERYYWKHLESGCAPLYGADLPGTLFDFTEVNNWNIGCLDNLLTRLDKAVPGVNRWESLKRAADCKIVRFYNLQLWRSTFAWHLVCALSLF